MLRRTPGVLTTVLALLVGLLTLVVSLGFSDSANAAQKARGAAARTHTVGLSAPSTVRAASTRPAAQSAPLVVRLGSGSYALSGTNIPRQADALVRYTRTTSQVRSPANQWGFELTVSGGRVTSVNDRQSTGAPGTVIPQGGYVLSGHGAARVWLLANAQVGQVVQIAPGTPTPSPTTSPSPSAAPSATPAPVSSPTSSAAPAPSAPVGNLPAKVVGGYLTTWEARNGVTLRSVVDNTSYNLIYVAFALGVDASSGTLQLDLPPGAASADDFRSQVAYANSKGKKVIVSVGGYYDLPHQTSGYNLSTAAKVDQFMASMRNLHDVWGFNGMDWDLEHGDRPDTAGIVSASQQMRAAFGPSWIICFAPGVNVATWVGSGGVLDQLGPNGWDAVGEQIYDQGISESDYQSLIVSRMTALANKYGADKVVLGNKYKDDSGTSLADPSNNFVDIATTKAALSSLRSAGLNIRGAFTWTIQSDSDVSFPWQGPSGVGGDVLSHP